MKIKPACTDEKFRDKSTLLASYADVFHRTSNLVILRCFVEEVKKYVKMKKDT